MGFIIAAIAFLTLFIIGNKLWCFRYRSKVCLVGKTAIVTGGTSGIGYQTALALAANGCRVIIAARDLVKASKAAEEIMKETHNPNIIVQKLELESFKSVREFAKEVVATEPRLDILICNAGIGGLGDEGQTEDGLQIMMQTNCFSHFLLTHLLLDLLKNSTPSRIIFTSSGLSYLSGLTVDTLSPKPEYVYRFTTKITAACYSNSKLALVAAAKMFGEKLKGTGVTANAVHPGGVRTPIYSNAYKSQKHPVIGLIWTLVYLFGKNCEDGAQTIIYLAQGDAVKNITGQFFAEGIRWPIPFQLNNDFCQKIWEKSIQYTKLDPNEVKC